MLCKKCGEQNPDGSFFCVRCGEFLSAENEQNETVQNQPNRLPDAFTVNGTSPTPKKETSKRAVILIVFAVVSIIALIVSGIYFMGRDSEFPNTSTAGEALKSNSSTAGMTYEEVVTAFAEAYWNGDWEKTIDYTIVDPDEVLKKYALETDTDFSPFFSELEKSFADEFDIQSEVKINSIKDYYTALGDVFLDELKTVTDQTVTVSNAKRIDLNSSSDMDALTRNLADCFWLLDELDGFKRKDIPNYIDMSKITKVYCVDVKFDYKDDGEPLSESDSFYVAKYNGEWRVCNDMMESFE